MASCFPKKINLTFKDQTSSLEGLHRHGMPLLVEELMKLHSDDAETLFDINIESTFLSENQEYDVPFCGFLHNSYVDYSDNNLEILFSNQRFLQSLIHCKGLFVFAKHIAKYLEDKLCEIGICVPVVYILHPTETDVAKFSLSAFKANTDKSIVQIGYWMRDLLGIFQLEATKEIVLGDGSVLQKRLLVPTGTELFESEEELIDNGDLCFFVSRPSRPVSRVLRALAEPSRPISRPISRPVNLDYEISILRRLAQTIPNFDLVYATEKLEAMAAVVKEINTLSDEQYDELLTQNVVFLKLVDAVAVNTVLECMSRATPIFVNRLPALEDLLGATYPGFYDDLESFVVDDALIEKSHRYLKNRKIDLTASTFLRKFMQSEIYRLLA